MDNAIAQIKQELKERQKILLDNNRLLEEQRLTQRTLFDIEMMTELGYCSGIENYSVFYRNVIQAIHRQHYLIIYQQMGYCLLTNRMWQFHSLVPCTMVTDPVN